MYVDLYRGFGMRVKIIKIHIIRYQKNIPLQQRNICYLVVTRQATQQKMQPYLGVCVVVCCLSMFGYGAFGLRYRGYISSNL